MNPCPKIEGRSLHTTSLFVNDPTVKAQKKVTFQKLLTAVRARENSSPTIGHPFALLPLPGSIGRETEP